MAQHRTPRMAARIVEPVAMPWSTSNTIRLVTSMCGRSIYASWRSLSRATHGLSAAGANAVLREEALDGIVVADAVPPFRLPSGLRSARG
jgi:hypothetical protein